MSEFYGFSLAYNLTLQEYNPYKNNSVKNIPVKDKAERMMAFVILSAVSLPYSAFLLFGFAISGGGVYISYIESNWKLFAQSIFVGVVFSSMTYNFIESKIPFKLVNTSWEFVNESLEFVNENAENLALAGLGVGLPYLVYQVLKMKRAFELRQNLDALKFDGCAICRDGTYLDDNRILFDYEKLTQLICGHWFCPECINEWFTVSRILSCPTCRVRL